MSWNYRIIRFPRSEKDAALTGIGMTHYFALHEVYYDDNGVPNRYTSEAVCFICDEPKEIRKSLGMALNDILIRPVLNVEDIKGYKPNG